MALLFARLWMKSHCFYLPTPTYMLRKQQRVLESVVTHSQPCGLEPRQAGGELFRDPPSLFPGHTVRLPRAALPGRLAGPAG